MARVNVQSWRETYRGLMADDVLDDPELPGMRERFWTDILTDERYRANRVAVAERGGDVIGIAMAAPTEGADARWAMRLYVLYVVAVEHGSGAGGELLDAVIAPHDSALLWVADPNPRAQAFYRKHGFVADGNVSVEAGVRAIRMVRTTALPRRAGPTPRRRDASPRQTTDAEQALLGHRACARASATRARAPAPRHRSSRPGSRSAAAGTARTRRRCRTAGPPR